MSTSFHAPGRRVVARVEKPEATGGHMRELPEVLVTSCRGADQGAMGVIRTLGRRGVRVSVLSDSERCLTRHSRYCASFTCRPDYTLDPRGTLQWMLHWARQRRTRPVLFPTADPDLKLVSTLRPEWEGHFQHFLGAPDLVERLMDKIQFMDLAALYDLPVPATHALESHARLLALSETVAYPVVVKPAHPGAWTHPEIQKVVAYRKAIIVEDAASLRRIVEAISPWNEELLIQECIVGPDDHHYSAHAYVREDGELQALFTGRKVRVHPAFAGSGCFVQSVQVPELLTLTRTILHQIRYRGIAVLNFKRDARTGRFLLHEINPRISQWNTLAAAAGVDVAWAAYADAAGVAVQPMRAQKETLQYVDLRNDLKSLATYRRAGVWDVRSYLGSLLQRRTVHQLLAWDDLIPFLMCAFGSLRSLVRRIRHRGGRRAPTLSPASSCACPPTRAVGLAATSRDTAVAGTSALAPPAGDVTKSRKGVAGHGLRSLVPVAASYEELGTATDAFLRTFV